MGFGSCCGSGQRRAEESSEGLSDATSGVVNQLELVVARCRWGFGDRLLDGSSATRGVSSS